VEAPFGGHTVKIALGYAIITFEYGSSVLIKVKVLRFQYSRFHFSRLKRKGQEHDKGRRYDADSGKNEKNLPYFTICLLHHTLSSFTAHFL
jgi:hypothetical protein